MNDMNGQLHMDLCYQLFLCIRYYTITQGSGRGSTVDTHRQGLFIQSLGEGYTAPEVYLQCACRQATVLWFYPKPRLMETSKTIFQKTNFFPCYFDRIFLQIYQGLVCTKGAPRTNFDWKIQRWHANQGTSYKDIMEVSMETGCTSHAEYLISCTACMKYAMSI